ncbi:MAG: efflux RND transporter permease subunit, partial [Coxiellaceae bacterium]|nr:efflux RND transporter permease subunit [Coxiellaceae bacterium]
FQQFSFTLAAAVLISGFIALTLTPMMCARLMKSGTSTRFDKALDFTFNGIRKGYRSTLNWTLRHISAPLLAFVLVLGGGVYAFKQLPTTLLPKEYAGFIFTVITTPDSASVAYTEHAAKQVIKEILSMPVVGNMVSFGGGSSNASNSGMSFIQLKKKYQDAKDNIKIAGAITKKFINFSPAKVFAIPLNINSNHNSGQPGQLTFYVSGYTSYPNLANIVENFVTQLRKTKLFLQVDNGLKYSSQQYTLNINREKAASLDLSIPSITSAISTFFGGYTIENGYQFNGINYPVIVQLPVDDMKDFKTLNEIYLFNKDGLAIPLSRVLTIKPSINLPSRTHNNGMRSAQVSLIPNPKMPSGQVVDTVNQLAKKVLPAGISLKKKKKVLDITKGNNTMMW